MVPLYSSSGKFKHVMTFKRVVYMILPENVNQLNVVFSAKIDDHVYKMYASTDVMTCHICGAYGYVKNSCPNVAMSSERQQQEIRDPPPPPTVERETIDPSRPPPVGGQEENDPSPLSSGEREAVDPSPRPIGGREKDPSPPPLVACEEDPSPPPMGEREEDSFPHTVQDSTDENMEVFITVAWKKGQKCSCPGVTERKEMHNKIQAVGLIRPSR